ncbi:hypothetical protein C4813_24095, partial [Salmonella enterica subsp. enterica serovar Rubislaw]|uniref:HAD hydrolase family protein n=1 Tax=Salmonella enterica TaxID=28901 RepID=UPI000D612FA2
FFFFYFLGGFLFFSFFFLGRGKMCTRGRIFPGRHRASGFSGFLKRRAMSPTIVVAIGDSGNDAEMLKMARYSFAMDNAAENIKQIARYATDNNKHEGALKVIQSGLENKVTLKL